MLGGVKRGDNLVWEVDSSIPFQTFVSSFLRSGARAGAELIMVSFNHSPQSVISRVGGVFPLENLILIDCFTSGKGNDDAVFSEFYKTGKDKVSNVIQIRKPAEMTNIRKYLDEIENKRGFHGRYVFDSLTGMLELWGNEATVLQFFTYSCPRLYDLGAIAYWFLETEAHSETFLANLKHITQVVIELSMIERENILTIKKAEDRFSSAIGVARQFEISDEEIKFFPDSSKLVKDEPVEQGSRLACESPLAIIGQRIKAERKRKGFSQTELGKMANLSPSAISQVETNRIQVSIEGLFRIAKALDVPMDYFFR